MQDPCARYSQRSEKIYVALRRVHDTSAVHKLVSSFKVINEMESMNCFTYLTRSVLTWSDRNTVQTAMHQHKSQMLWFRKLYIGFSRYMLINSLSELNLESIEFDILES